MIISDAYKFVFIHIPKCGGSSVRGFLHNYQQHGNKFTGRVEMHPELGPINMAHIPMVALNKYFPDDFASVQNYWSFAILRDPFSRFASSVSQRLRQYGKNSIDQITAVELQSVVDQAIKFLSKNKNKWLLPAEYVHFQRQMDYVSFGGRVAVSKLYILENLDLLVADMQKRLNIDPSWPQTKAASSSRKNQTLVFRNDLIRVIYTATKSLRYFFSGYFPDSVKRNLHSMIYVPRGDRFKELFESWEVRSFVSDFYAEDIALHARVMRLNGVS